jgi:hypothetical protein
MRLKYGNFIFDEAECLVTYNGGQRVYGPRGLATSFVRTWIIEGEIVAATQADIETRRQTIEGALAIEVSEAALLFDNSTVPTYVLTAHKGVRLLELAWLQEEARAHFATALPFRIRLSGESFISEGDKHNA